MYLAWLNYLEKGLSVAYELAERGNQSTGELGVSESVTGVRWYATDLALLTALIYRAAGRRKDEVICFDLELSQMCDQLDGLFPKLRDLRNALFAHPPFVDDVVAPEEALLFSTMGVHVTTIDGGKVETIVDPFMAHMQLPSIFQRVREIFVARQESAAHRDGHLPDDAKT
jgi:hypothetical protein